MLVPHELVKLRWYYIIHMSTMQCIITVAVTQPVEVNLYNSYLQENGEN